MTACIPFDSAESHLLNVIGNSNVRTLAGLAVVVLAKTDVATATKLSALGFVQFIANEAGVDLISLTERGRSEIDRLDAVFERRILTGSILPDGTFVIPDGSEDR